MNRMRVAALLRELADEIEADGDVPAEAPSRPRSKRDRRPPTIVRPAGEARLPTTASMAGKILRERGYR